MRKASVGMYSGCDTLSLRILFLYCFALPSSFNFYSIVFYTCYYSPCPNLEGIKNALSYKFRRLTIVVVPCAQTRLPRPWGHRDAFSSSSERRKRRAFGQACSAGHRASSEARGDVCSLSWSGGRFDVRAERELRHLIHDEFDQLLLASSEGCGLHLRMRAILDCTIACC